MQRSYPNPKRYSKGNPNKSLLRDGSMMGLEMRLFDRPLAVLIDHLNFSRRLTYVWRCIEANYADPALTRRQAGRQCGISTNHLDTLLQQATGLTFKQLLTRYQLLKAVEIMWKKDDGLVELALEVGFDNPLSFRRNFKKLLGCSPREFRKQIRPNRNF